jgi:DNA processing protein
LYIKGNKQILHEKSIAIVGSRAAEETSLKFTDNIAKLASNDFKVVVSGFAKGVDKQALDSAIKYKGQSIIVLPQGITTFSSGFKTYYKQIVDGDVLALSTFHPKAVWSAGLAMARNPIIYGLADEIYVAESSEKGGTWSGVIDGLRKGRKIFVRQTESYEKNANSLLIQKGAIAVNYNGIERITTVHTEQNILSSFVNEPSISIENFKIF